MYPVLSVDPGLSGAVTLYDPRGPSLELRRDFKTSEDITRAVVELRPRAAFGVVEYVGARPGQGVCSMFSFGQMTGIAMGALDALNLPWVDVAPQTWQAWCRKELGMPTADSREMARVAFAFAPSRLWDRVKDHNSADAALMALWGSQRALSHKASGGGKRSRTHLPPAETLVVPVISPSPWSGDVDPRR
jgi:hypothetical protein